MSKQSGTMSSKPAVQRRVRIVGNAKTWLQQLPDEHSKSAYFRMFFVKLSSKQFTP